MASNYIFSLQPTFTQGLILGQLSILLIFGLILKYLFLDSTQYPFETSSYHPRVDSELVVKNKKGPKQPSEGDESGTEWLNVLLQEVVGVYRSKLRDHLPGLEGDEVARQRVEEFANKIRPTSFLGHIQVLSVDLGQSAPRLHNGRRTRKATDTIPSETAFDVKYLDTISLSLSTSCLFNYPMPSFARLPVSLTISLSNFESSVNVSPPLPSSPAPSLKITIAPNFHLDLTTTSLMGSRAKLANVPKLHELIEHQVRRILASRASWQVPLPGLSIPVVPIKDTVIEQPTIPAFQTSNPFL